MECRLCKKENEGNPNDLHEYLLSRYSRHYSGTNSLEPDDTIAIFHQKIEAHYVQGLMRQGMGNTKRANELFPVWKVHETQYGKYYELLTDGD